MCYMWHNYVPWVCPILLDVFRDRVALFYPFLQVQFLKWVFPPRGVVEGNIGRTAWNVSDDANMCQSVLMVRIGPKKSGINLPVPAGGSQASLPTVLQATVTGGALITMERPPNAGVNYGPFLEWVRFSGRVIYPASSSLYKNV